MTTQTSQAVTYEVTREESFDDVRDDLAAIHSATRSRTSTAERFNWLYRDNPDGEAVIWSLRKGDTGEMVGFTACLPRRMIVDGKPRRAWIGSDFSVLPKYRTLGLASKLRRAAKDCIDTGEVDFLYAHPNDRMATIHQRVGHQQIGLMQRYAKPFTVKPILDEKLKSPLATRAGQLLIDPLLNLLDARHQFRRTHEVNELPEARFDASFDELFNRHSPDSGVIGVRDAAYLNWRYGQNPVYQSHLLTAHAKGELAGYLVFTVADETAYIKDVFPNDNACVVTDLLAELARSGKRQGLRSASYTLFEQHPSLPVLRSLGYRSRLEQSQMFAHAATESAWRPTILDKTQWSITVGDRDV